MAHDRNFSASNRRAGGRLLIAAGAVALGIATLPAAGLAQVGTISQPVVQALPNRMGVTLNQALARLGQNPRDIDALIDAGNAALAMGDVDAAVGFLRRADQISPGNGRVKAGLAGALVHSENPFEAIPMFEEAERAGATDGALAGERGLAYDLVGDNEKAQRYYRLALGRGNDDEITRRLALSYAIVGDRASSETVLNPLLIRQDKAAWRTRAFVLAILGQVDEAVSIAGRTLPPALSAGISPYLRYMPKLTAAQQAAAAHLGHFPRASEIGRDDPRVALFAPKTPPRRQAQVAAAEPVAVRGQPLSRSERKRAARAAAARLTAERRTRPGSMLAARTAKPSPAARTDLVTPQATTTRAAATGELPAVSPAAPQPSRSRSGVANDDGPAFTQSASRSRRSDTASAPNPVPSSAPATAMGAKIAAPAPRPAIVLPQTVQRPAPSAASAATVSTPAPGIAAPGTALTGAAGAAVPGPSLSISSPPVQGPPAPSRGEQSTAPHTPPLGAVLGQSPPAPAAAVAAPPAALPAADPPPKPASLAEAFKEFLQPPKVDVAPAEGAVDIRHLLPSRQAEARPAQITGNRPAPIDARLAKKDKPAAAVKPAPPSHPSRIWVQVATGRNKAALAFDWRRMTREAAQVFRGKQAFLSAWGQTNRLLTGPFPSEATATAFITQLRRAEVDGAFVWSSPAGQIVDPIAAK